MLWRLSQAGSQFGVALGEVSQVLAPRAPGPAYQTMLRQYVDGFAARGASMIDIQAQSLESNPSAYLD